MFQQQGVAQSATSAGDTQALYAAKTTVNPPRTKPTSPMSNPNSRSNQYASLPSYNRSSTNMTDVRGHSSKSRHEHRHSSRQRNANGTSSSNYRSSSGGPSTRSGSRYRDSGRYRPY